MDPRRRNLIVVIVVVIFVVAGVGTYYVLRHSPAVSSCGSNETGVICVDQAEIPDSLDPAVTFSTPGWAAVQQVYQGLVNYNGSSSTAFSGVLAKNWTVADDSTTGFQSFVFTLRQGVNFSNGDPYNAYVQWYSLYRSLLLIQGPQFILAQNFWSTNFSTTSPLSYYSVNTSSAAANTTLANDLNSWNFDSPTAGEIANMSVADQSFQVINEYSIALNLGYGYLASNYTYLLASISAPNSYAVDPTWVDAHGGVQVGQVNTYLATSTLGTGPYLLQNYNGIGGGGYTLTPNSNYWGASAFKTEPWNINLASGNTTVDVIFQGAIDITTNDLLTGAVQEASFAYVGPSTILQLEGHSNVVVQALPTVYGATSGSWWIYLNSSVAPFNNLSVREAISHAIDYQQIITQAFGGYAQQWVGPVPPRTRTTTTSRRTIPTTRTTSRSRSPRLRTRRARTMPAAVRSTTSISTPATIGSRPHSSWNRTCRRSVSTSTPWASASPSSTRSRDWIRTGPASPRRARTAGRSTWARSSTRPTTSHRTTGPRTTSLRPGAPTSAWADSTAWRRRRTAATSTT